MRNRRRVHGGIPTCADQISRHTLDWYAGFAGTMLPLLVVNTDLPMLPGSGLLMIGGSLSAAAALLSLGRSFGIVRGELRRPDGRPLPRGSPSDVLRVLSDEHRGAS
jgi:hypothetical protein